ncbi:MAG: tetratricopeptide repeat protein [Kiritimatiellae bacterium]|nr:tetratricopeptide repeat protein [Kiritimatiellia bacterium]
MQLATPNIDLYSAGDYIAARKKLARKVGLGVLIFTALVYLATFSTGVFPGESASLMAVHSGLEPLIAPSHALWGGIVSKLAALGPKGMVFRLNFFSFLTGLLGIWLMFDLLVSVVGSLIERETASPKMAAMASVLAGAGAALALAFSVPYWMTATRLQYQGFNLVLLLLVLRSLVWYLDTENAYVLVFIALLAGVTCVEAFYIACFLPFVAAAVIVRWVRRGSMRAASVAAVAIAFVIGLSSVALVAHLFKQGHDVSLRGYTDIWSIVRSILVDQAKFIMGVSRHTGWLNILVLTITPWLAAAAISARSLNETREWGIMIMHAAMSVAVALVLGNAPAISPWGIFRTEGILPVPLLAMSAMTMGYLLAYWYLIIANSSQVNIDGERTFAQRSSIWFGWVFGIITVATMVITSGINVLEASGRSGRFADECTREIINSLDGRKWIVTDGLFDSHLVIEAHCTGKNIRLIELQNNDNKVYLRYLRGVINEDPDFRAPGIDIGKMENAVDLNVVTFLQDWLESNPSAIDGMYFMTAPDIILSAGKIVVPHKFCFKAGDSLDAVKNVDFLPEQKAFWERMRTLLAKSRGVRDAASAIRARCRRQVGFVANNAGVLLEDLEREEDAYQTYLFVRELDPENISTLLNLVELLNRKREENFHADMLKDIEGSIKRIIEDLQGRRLPIWSLSRVFGYVRSPILFTQLGWSWAASGQPGIALSGIQRAEAIAATPAARIRAKQAEAQLLWQQNDVEGSEAVFEQILKEDPTNASAMISIARVQVRRGALDRAREWLTRARDNGADKTSLAFESATLDLASGHASDARVKLSEVTDLQPNNLPAWALLGIATLQMEDYDDIEARIIPAMVTAAGTTDNYYVLILKGQVLFQRKNLAEARDTFERALMLRPGLTTLMEWILRLDFALDDKAAAEEHARQLMRNNRSNGFANYIMGSIMLFRGRNAEAEDYLRRSVSASATPEALNDLAELLRIVGNLGEAKRRIREAIGMAPDFYVLWDTLGGILADEGDIDGAAEAFAKALELDKSDVRVNINYARILIRKGDIVKARSLLAEANKNRSVLTAADQKSLDDLLEQVAPGKGRR